MDYIAFCRNYFDVTKIPVSLLKSGYVAYYLHCRAPVHRAADLLADVAF